MQPPTPEVLRLFHRKAPLPPGVEERVRAYLEELRTPRRVRRKKQILERKQERKDNYQASLKLRARATKEEPGDRPPQEPS